MGVTGTKAEYTQNVYVQDLTNKRIFYRGYNDLSIRYIDNYHSISHVFYLLTTSLWMVWLTQRQI